MQKLKAALWGVSAARDALKNEPDAPMRRREARHDDFEKQSSPDTGKRKRRVQGLPEPYSGIDIIGKEL